MTLGYRQQSKAAACRMASWVFDKTWRRYLADFFPSSFKKKPTVSHSRFVSYTETNRTASSQQIETGQVLTAGFPHQLSKRSRTASHSRLKPDRCSPQPRQHHPTTILPQSRLTGLLPPRQRGHHSTETLVQSCLTGLLSPRQRQHHPKATLPRSRSTSILFDRFSLSVS